MMDLLFHAINVQLTGCSSFPSKWARVCLCELGLSDAGAFLSLYIVSVTDGGRSEVVFHVYTEYGNFYLLPPIGQSVVQYVAAISDIFYLRLFTIDQVANNQWLINFQWEI